MAIAKKKTKTKTKKKTSVTTSSQCVLAEEDGLVTLIVNPAISAKGAGRSALVRVRLTPPANALREDDHVFDVPAALAFVLKSVRAPLEKLAAVWLDTAIGNGRVTVSFMINPKSKAKINAIIRALDIGPYELEEIVNEARASARVTRNRSDLSLFAKSPLRPTPKGSAKLPKISAKGSFRTEVGLDKRVLSLAGVKKGLRWLDGELARVEKNVLEAIGADPKKVQLALYVNAHPRMRQVAFSVVDRLDGYTWADRELPEEVDNALHQILDIPSEDSRRIPGVLWAKDALDLKGMKRILITAES